MRLTSRASAPARRCSRAGYCWPLTLGEAVGQGPGRDPGAELVGVLLRHDAVGDGEVEQLADVGDPDGRGQALQRVRDRELGQRDVEAVGGLRVRGGPVGASRASSGVAPSGAVGGVIPSRSRSPEASWDAAENSGFCETCHAATPRTRATPEVTAAIATAIAGAGPLAAVLGLPGVGCGVAGDVPGAVARRRTRAVPGVVPGAVAGRVARRPAGRRVGTRDRGRVVLSGRGGRVHVGHAHHCDPRRDGAPTHRVRAPIVRCSDQVRMASEVSGSK